MQLERKKNQSIVIQTPDGTEIDITIDKIDKGKVKLNVDAPDEFIVLEEEMVEDPSMELKINW